MKLRMFDAAKLRNALFQSGTSLIEEDASARDLLVIANAARCCGQIVKMASFFFQIHFWTQRGTLGSAFQSDAIAVMTLFLLLTRTSAKKALTHSGSAWTTAEPCNHVPT